jgi:hypothetical protein
MSITTRQEAVMGQAIPQQHPAVVLRSHYRQLRALLAIAMVAVVALSATLVIVATDDQSATTAPLAQQARTDGGPEESHVAAAVGAGASAVPEVSRPDESKIAATLGGSGELPLDDSRPDESKTAAAISGD